MVPMFISWAITLIMAMQSEIGLVSSNTSKWLIHILMVITFMVLLGSSFRRRRPSWSGEVRQRLEGQTELMPTSNVKEINV